VYSQLSVNVDHVAFDWPCHSRHPTCRSGQRNRWLW